MVSGTQWPGGDPFLQRQNGPSMAVSTRNPLHVVSGDNDYRTVDIPGLPDGQLAGDAWLGFFQSLDGGQTWTSTLVPGYPQDKSVLGTNLPLHRFQAGTDPVMRAGTNGMFYYAGLVFNRTPVAGGNFGASAIVVSRYIDNNSSASPIQFLDSSVVAQGAPPTGFTDKPWIAVDIPRAGAALCVVNADGQQQSFPAGNVYVTYTNFQNDQLHGAITFQRSTDCGVTWGAPIQFTDASLTRQGSAIAVDPNTGTVYVAWRQFSGVGAAVDAVYIVKSSDGGQTFSAPQLVAQINPFDQGSTSVSFRTNSYPAVVVDGNGLVYVAWAQRNVGPGNDARIVVSTSPDGTAWTGPNAVDNQPNRGHQFMPALTFAAGTLMATYYDLRQDSTEGIFTPLGGGLFTEARQAIGDLLVNPVTVFSFFVDDTPPRTLRHTIEVWVAQALPAAIPVFQSARVSNFEFGSVPDSLTVQQLQVDPPNFPMFSGGTQAYIGDYIDVAALQFVQNAAGAWVYNTAPANDTVFHVGWTDNRDVRPPANGDWTKYTPAQSLGQTSIFDNTQASGPCVNGQEGMRNQNIYTANVTQGMIAGAPTNAKALGSLIRAFPITVENTSGNPLSVRLTILNQPPGGRATFTQSTSQPVPTLRLDVTIPAHSTIARSVFASSSSPQAQVRVSVQQILAPGGALVAGGLQSTIVLNPDSTDPNLIPGQPGFNNEGYTPTIANPNIANPNIANPNIANPNIANPNIANPNIANPNIANPNIANPNIANPNIANPNIANPNIANPNISADDLSKGTVQDLTWNVTNIGNSAMAYTIKTLLNGQLPQGFITQLMISQAYTTPVALNCTLGVDVHTKLLTNIVNPVLEQANANDAGDPAITNSAINDPTVSLGPGESASLTIRIVNPDKTTNTNFNPLNTFVATVTSHGANNTSVQQGNLQPPVAASQVIILNQGLANAALATPYSAQLLSTGAVGAVTWSSNNLPANGLSLNSATGVISGTPTVAAPINITVTAQDTGSPNSATRSFIINVASPAAPVISTTTLAVAYPSTTYSFTLIAGGGAGAKTWTITAGALPAGLLLNASTGAIAGLAIGVGSSNFTVTVTDALSRQASKAFTLQVAPLTLSFVQQPAGGNSFHQNPVQVKAVNSAGTGISGLIVSIQVILPNHNPLTTVFVVTGAGGIASTNISINLPGVNYTLVASSVGVAPVTSTPFTITAVGSVPQLLVADGSSGLANGSLIQVAADGSSATVPASTGGCPSSVALDSSANRFVADPCSDSILEVTPGGAVSTFFTGAPLQNPVAVAVDLNGNIIVGDDSTDTVYRINSAGNSIVSIAALSPSPANLQDIAMVVDSAGNVIVANDDVTSPGVASELLKIAPGGAVTTVYRGTAITSTTGLVIDLSGNYVVASPLQNAVLSVSPQGSIKVVAAGTAFMDGMTGLAIDAFGNFYTALNTLPGLLEVTPAGEILPVFSGAPLTAPNALVVLP